MAQFTPERSAKNQNESENELVSVEVLEEVETVTVSPIEPAAPRLPPPSKRGRKSKAEKAREEEDEVIDVEGGIEEGVHNLLFFAAQCNKSVKGGQTRPSSSPAAGSSQKVSRKRASRDDSAITSLKHFSPSAVPIRETITLPGTSVNTLYSKRLANGNSRGHTVPAGTIVMGPSGTYRTIPTVATYATNYASARPMQTVKVIQKNKQTNRMEVGVYNPPLIAPKLPNRPIKIEPPPSRSISPRSLSPDLDSDSQPGSSRASRKQRLPLGVRKYRHNTAGSKYPKLDRNLSQEKLDGIMNQNMQRHYMHYCATDLARQALDMRASAPEIVRDWMDKLFGDYWRLFFGFDEAEEDM